jgi:peptidoglycan-associated lipoprotein
MRKLIIAAVMAALMAGCSSTPTQDAAPIDDRAATAGAAAPGSGGATTAGTAPSNVSGTPAGSAGSLDPALRDPRSPLSKRTILFDYDSFVVKDEYRPVVDAHAKYLQSHKSTKVTLQGHADERGSREYNIALGQKRADSVKNLLLLLGATEVQIETVSFGKEKPKVDGHDESAWSQNRRVEIIYVGE